ncbi:MAG: hydrogenase maturation protease [Candidatus Omnitrophota bacterium]
MSNSSNKFAVIGLGNTLRRDDGIGIVILESLLNSCKRERVDYFNFGIASFDLIYKLREYDSVLLIDGLDAGLAAGELKIFELKDISYHLKGPALSTHEFDLKSLFELYKRFELKSKIYVAGIQVQDVSFGDSLSQPLKDSLEHSISETRLFIDKTLLSF